MSLKLYPYQLDGVRRIHEAGDKALLADDMGLGKTIQSTKAVQECNKWPGVVVCPANLKRQWQAEMKQHFGIESVLLEGETPYVTDEMKKGKAFIVNYEILSSWLNFLYRRNLQWVIGDEIQRIGNINSKQSRYFTALCKDVPMLVFLSGTPVNNCPWEFFPALSLLRPKIFDSPWTFGMEYCDGTKSFGKWQFKGARNMLELHSVLTEGKFVDGKMIKGGSSCMIRRTKAQVGLEIPPIRRTVTVLEMENEKEYKEAETDLIGWLWRMGKTEQAMRAIKMERLTRFTYLKHLAAVGKLPYVIQLIEDFLDQTNQKLMVGTIHNDVIDRLEAHPWKTNHVSIRGSLSQTRKDTNTDQYRNDPSTRIIFGQVKAIGVGYNLPETGRAMLAELPFTPTACKQLEARGNRITSKNPLDVVYMIAGGSIEEKLCQIIQRKEGFSDALLDGVVVQDTSLTIYDELQMALLNDGNYDKKVKESRRNDGA